MIYIPDIQKNTLVDMPRLKIIGEQVEKTYFKEGSIVEVGVYKGGTALLTCLNTCKHVFLFDTFEGMPEVSEYDSTHKKGDFSDTSLEHVSNLLESSNCYKFSLYKGIFPAQNSEYVEFRKFSYVHLDVDIYTSVKDCLAFFHPRMLPGGVIILDDYNEPDCPGAKLAADEFYSGKSQKITSTVQSQALIQY